MDFNGDDKRNAVILRCAQNDGGISMKLVFCGTPAFAVPVLEAVIAAGHEVSLVVTQPDRAVGRAQQVQPPPIKLTALAHGITVTQPEKIKNNLKLREQLEAIKPDAILVVAYGRIIPQWMLDLPRLGNINLHGSLLPKYRGAAPIQWAIAKGEQVTGVTTMLLDAGLDTGPMLLAKTIPIAEGETAEDLFEALSAQGADLMVATLTGLEDGSITPQPQDDSLATYAPILKREDGLISLARSSKQIFDCWRGFQPWPGAYTSLRGKKLIIHRMSISAVAVAVPGELLVEGERLFVGCAEASAIEFLEVQMEGKRRMSAAEFLHGHQVKSGERLE